MIIHGCKDCVIGHFVKFGGGDVVHHNRTMHEECISIAITSYVLVGVHLLYLEHDHDLPLCTLDNTIGYIILSP
jgi:hypothetical protein